MHKARSTKEAESHADRPEWAAAENSELSALIDLGCWEVVDVGSVPVGTRIYRCKWVYKQKPDRKKARLCVLGNQQHPCDYDETHAPVSRMETNRRLLAAAAVHGWDIHLVDIQNAFVNSMLDRPVYMRFPEGHEQAGKVCKLRRALYGLKQSPHCWNTHFDRWLKRHGFRQLSSDSCVYMLEKGGKKVFVSVYVDDNLVIGDAALCQHVKALMQKDYKVRDYGQPDSFLGIDLGRSPDGTVTISQSTYIRAMAARFGLSDVPAPSTPLTPNVTLTPRQDGELACDGHLYRSIVGSIMYASTCTRPDVAFAVKELS